MALQTTDVSHGLTINFATSGFTADLVGADGGNMGVGEINATAINQALDTEQWRPGKVKKMGTVDIALNYDPNAQPPANGVTEVVTITYGILTGSGNTNGATITGQAFVRDWSWSVGESDDKMTATATLRWTGKDSAGTAAGPVYAVAS